VTSPQKSTAIKEDVEFRRGLPTDYKLIMGVSNSDREDRRVEREQFSNVVMSLMQNMIQYADIDTACDQLAANDTHCALPPVLSKDEMSRTVQCLLFRTRLTLNSILGGKPIVENGVVKNTCYKLDENTEIRLLRQQSARVIMSDEGKISLCHSNDNPRYENSHDYAFYVF
jgi:lysine-specific demethylase/histidyl-hydroxylase NO66